MSLDWLKRAACVGADPNIFYADDGGNPSYYEARKLCSRCPVIDECRDAAMTTERELPRKMRIGFIANLTPEERHRGEHPKPGHPHPLKGTGVTKQNGRCVTCLRDMWIVARRMCHSCYQRARTAA